MRKIEAFIWYQKMNPKVFGSYTFNWIVTYMQWLAVVVRAHSTRVILDLEQYYEHVANVCENLLTVNIIRLYNYTYGNFTLAK